MESELFSSLRLEWDLILRALIVEKPSSLLQADPKMVGKKKPSVEWKTDWSCWAL